MLQHWMALCMLAAASTGAQEFYQKKSSYRNILVYADQGLRRMKFGRGDAGRQTCISPAKPDAFDHLYVPEHMLTQGYLQEVNSLLGNNRVIAANTFSAYKLNNAESAAYASIFIW